ncbi:3-deoxy-D-manno-octulosonic acid kinase [Orrella sp. JC864]|uniref:3-deoxy-D-manno-octulosonic acid kinase n=1 Tax=Orrella sp. JC864 TaxID=3120298 RepID=UPI0012BC69CF
MLLGPRLAGVAATPALFDPLAGGAQASAVGEGGRQAAWFVQAGGVPAVLRHYRRGGLVGKLVRQSYLWQGEARTRPFAEFCVMARLHAAGLPVPAPLAAAYWRGGLSYRGALLTERIPGARALARRLDEPLWEPAARVIAALHAQGVWHADLNAYNLLFDAQDRPWLIDFDRAREGPLSAAQRLGNLRRLARSLEKVAGPQGVAYGQRIMQAYEQCWAALRHAG